MSPILAIGQAAVLLGGVGLWLALARRPGVTSSRNAGAALAFAWIAISSLMLLRLVQSLDLLPPHAAHETEPYSLAVMLALSTSVLVGPVVVLALPGSGLLRCNAVAVAGLALHIMLYASPLPLLVAPSALLAAPAVVLPAHALATWTAGDRRIGPRSALQALIWLTLLLWVFPDLAMQALGRSWRWPLESLAGNALLLLPLGVPLGLIVAALTQFASEGHGTGFPYDPPKRLVRGGIYAWIRNPMQLGICLLMAWWGVVIGLWLVTASAAVAALLFVVFRDVCSGVSNVAISDPGWEDYKANVPAWLPRRTRWQAPVDRQPAA